MIDDEIWLKNLYRVAKLNNTGARIEQLDERTNGGHFNIFRKHFEKFKRTALLRYYFTNYNSY